MTSSGANLIAVRHVAVALGPKMMDMAPAVRSDWNNTVVLVLCPSKPEGCIVLPSSPILSLASIRSSRLC